MKNILYLLLFLGITTTASAQLNLEHTYPSAGAFRMIHPTYGTVYAYTSINSVARTYHFFDSLHQNIQTTTAAVPDTLPSASSTLFSSDLFDNDPGIEVLVFWGSPAGSPHYGFVYDEDGQVMNANPIYSNSPVFVNRPHRFDDGTWQLQVNNLIYDLQTYELLHDITDYATMPFGYKSVDLDRKYCYLNNNGQFVALNQDFSVFQMSDPLVDISCDPVMDVMEQKVINPNDELEWVVSEFCTGANEINVYSGSTLVFNYQPNGTINIPIKLLPQFASGIDAPKLLVNNLGIDTTRVFNLLTGAEEWKIENRYIYRIFEPNMAYFVRSPLDVNEIYHTVYGMDYQAAASFYKTPGQSAIVMDVSNQTFDDDPTTYEMMYRYTTAPFYSEIVRENTAILATLDSVSNPLISRIPGFANKLIARTSGANAWSKVYSLPIGTVGTWVPDLAFPLLLWPNPVSDHLFIDPQTFPANKANVRIFDPLGRTVWQQYVSSTEVLDVNTQDWPAGLYVVQVVSAGKTTSRTVVKQP